VNDLYSGNTRVLVLDDDEDMRFAITRILTKCDCEVVEAVSVKAALAHLEQEEIDVIFSDLRIPGADGGEELLKIVVEKYPEIHTVLMSCAMNRDLTKQLIDLGASYCIKKPFYKDECMEILQELSGPLRKSA